MLSFQTILSFFSASILLGLAPGPDNIFVLTQSTLYGHKAGLLVTLGLCTGLLFHSTIVALGVAALIKASVVAFSILKFCGAGYLLYLSFKFFRSKPMSVNDNENRLSSAGLYSRGIIMNITNPKVSIFFLAFLPQFTNPEMGSITTQIFFLAGLFVLATILVFGTIAMISGYLSKILGKSPKVQNVVNKIAGIVFIILALKLISSKV